MSSEEDITEESGVQEASAIIRAASLPEDDLHIMKRVAARQLIERYYSQLTDGCGRRDCVNKHCASSGSHFAYAGLSPDRAAVAAISLVKKRARLCGDAKTSRDGATSQLDTSSSGQSTSADEPKSTELLTEQTLVDVISSCSASSNWTPLIRLIGNVFSSPESLATSFPHRDDPDKDRDETETVQNSGVDMAAVKRCYTILFDVPSRPFLPALHTALRSLACTAQMQLRLHMTAVDHVCALAVAMEVPALASVDFVEGATPALCRAITCLTTDGQARLVKMWATHKAERLKEIVDCLQQVITVRVLSLTYSPSHSVNDDVDLTSAARVLKIAYYASILSGRSDPPALLAAERCHNAQANDALAQILGSSPASNKARGVQRKDPLQTALGVRPIDCRVPAVPWMDFINEPLSEVIDMEKDYTYYRATDLNPEAMEGKLSFMTHAFLLTTAVKSLGMYNDNRVRMLHERRASIFHNLAHGAPITLYLRLRIRRDHIIDDALVALEMFAMENPHDLKKQLYVEFEGEQGIDEGGVSKEFFQLVIEELFNPDIGMFTYSTETHTFWPNAGSFETDGQFTLIGVLLGLAIYNNVILDVHLPEVAYRKLLGKDGCFEDLQHINPTLAHSLQDLLAYDGDVQETFMQSFMISFTDIFGANMTHELKPGGAEIPVTNDNRQEYVDLYADFLLNKAVGRQFIALRRGFQMVTDESPLQTLFTPDEIELLVCGSKNFNFDALEEAAEYDGGFLDTSPTVRHFWNVVHSFTEAQKRKLLQFTTGSDRVPVGGLSKLKLIISRNGPDSDRLPTAHTCFNVLLLPDYGDQSKLCERLLIAINYSKGFGML